MIFFLPLTLLRAVTGQKDLFDEAWKGIGFSALAWWLLWRLVTRSWL